TGEPENSAGTATMDDGARTGHRSPDVGSFEEDWRRSLDTWLDVPQRRRPGNSAEPNDSRKRSPRQLRQRRSLPDKPMAPHVFPGYREKPRGQGDYRRSDDQPDGCAPPLYNQWGMVFIR